MYVARAILVLLGLFLVGLVGYEIGVSQATATPAPAASAPLYWYGPGLLVSGLVAFFVPLLFLFLIFGLFRVAFGGGRHAGHHGGWGGWTSRERIAELHRELHGERPARAEDESGGTSRA